MDNNKISFKKFVNEIADPKVKKEIRIIGIVGYVLAALNLILMGLYGIFDICFIAGLSLGMHIGKSRICAVLFLVYGVINVIVMTGLNGTLSGYWPLLLAVCAINEFYKAHKQYKSYINNRF